MARSKWKFKYYSKSIVRKLFSYSFFKKKPRERFIYSRNSTIPFSFISRIIRIHKGNYFNFVLISIYNIGFKFGEFSITKKPFHFPLKKKKK